MRITIDENYALDADMSSVTLLHISVVTGNGRGAHKVKKENIGTQREVACGYYASVRDALVKYVDLSLRRYGEASNLSAFLMEFDRRIRHIEDLVAKIAPGIDAPAKKPSSPVSLPTPPNLELDWSHLSMEVRQRLLDQAGIKVALESAEQEPEEITLEEPEKFAKVPVGISVEEVKPKKHVRPEPPKPPANATVKESDPPMPVPQTSVGGPRRPRFAAR